MIFCPIFNFLKVLCSTLDDKDLSLRKDENNGDYQANEHITRLSS